MDSHAFFTWLWNIYFDVLMVVFFVTALITTGFSVVAFTFKQVLNSVRAMRRAWRDEPEPKPEPLFGSK